MPIYLFECKNGHNTEEYMRVADRVDSIRCPSCFEEALISIPKRQSVRTFKPYVESNFNGKPIMVTSKDQRDKLCKKFHVTYDTFKNGVPKKEVKAAVEDLDYSVVKQTIETGRTPDGEKVQGTVDPAIPTD